MTRNDRIALREVLEELAADEGLSERERAKAWETLEELRRQARDRALLRLMLSRKDEAR